MTTHYFTSDDTGCYADGGLGHDHVRARLADLIESENATLAAELRGEPSDDMAEERDALDILNARSFGVEWSFDAGDLICADAEGELRAETSPGGTPLRTWDEGFGPLWVYRETLGPLGVIRAKNEAEAWQCAVDEIMDGGTLAETLDNAGMDASELPEGELPECCHYRGSGEPSSPWARGLIAWEDINGSSLERLTPDLAEQLRITVSFD